MWNEAVKKVNFNLSGSEREKWVEINVIYIHFLFVVNSERNLLTHLPLSITNLKKKQNIDWFNEQVGR